MINVGLTGGIASGKSTVAQMFVNEGGRLIDFDLLAHEVQSPGKPAWRDVVSFFGEGVLREDQTIDREKLAAIVFNDPDRLKTLNTIVHPRVFEAWLERLEAIRAQDETAIVFSDVPLLFEGGMQTLFDLTVLVMVEPEKQIERLMARNGLSSREARLRLAAQMPIEQKVALADVVIPNDTDLDETRSRVAVVWQDLVAREGRKRKEG